MHDRLLDPLIAGVLSQTVTLTGIALIDKNGDSRFEAFVSEGRLLATLTTSASGVAMSTNGTICGPLDSATATFLCSQLGYVGITVGTEGTVYGVDEDTGTPTAIRNLDCNGASGLEDCQFEVLSAPDPSCTHSQDATVECSKWVVCAGSLYFTQ